MGSTDGVVEIDFLERRLLSDVVSHEESESEDEIVLYRASFDEMEENYLKYQTAQWVLYSLLLILAWGIGLLMLLYLPVRRYILRKEFQSRKLYITPDGIVYKVTRPVPFPCCGVLNKEKHVLLPSVADIVIEQGYLQSFFGIYSVRIENTGVRRPACDDVQIQGIANPWAFRKAVLTHLSNLMSEGFSRQHSTNEDQPTSVLSYSPAAWLRLGTGLTSIPMSPSKYYRHEFSNPPGELLLQKLGEVGSSLKRVECLIEQKSQTSEALV